MDELGEVAGHRVNVQLAPALARYYLRGTERVAATGAMDGRRSSSLIRCNARLKGISPCVPLLSQACLLA
jgi:hypothetical protein